jgi:fused signal recognition particle receptor
MFDSLKKKLFSFIKKAEDEAEDDNARVPKKAKPAGEHLKPTDKKTPQEPKQKIAPKESEWKASKQKPLLSDVEGGFFGQEITEKKLDELLWELELALLESDVAMPVVDEIKSYLKKELLGKKIQRKYDLAQIIEDALKNAISNVLSANYINFDKYILEHKKPVVLMFVGVNGTGKTTAIAKIANRLQKKGMSCVLAAGDTFRAGAIEQLTIHSERLNAKIIKNQPGSDPAAIAYDAIEHAKARNKDVVLIDTAGRMQTNVNLMDEMKKIKRIASPDMIIFVGDALAGNDAVIQAQKFNEAVSIDTAILTKIDADAKGGAALSIAKAVGKPIIFVSTGQGYEDIQPFNPKWMIDRLFAES